jgi:hypothetical protein
MSNLWMKKNPLLSIWLSSFNSAMGSARGHATAAAKRQARTMMSTAAKQMANYWDSALEPRSTPKKRNRAKTRRTGRR